MSAEQFCLSMISAHSNPQVCSSIVGSVMQGTCVGGPTGMSLLFHSLPLKVTRLSQPSSSLPACRSTELPECGVQMTCLVEPRETILE